MRRSPAVATALFAAWFASTAAGAEPAPMASSPAAVEPAAPPSLVNARDPLPGLRTGGIPKEVDVFPSLAAEGFRTLVDLRAEPEPIATARAAAEAAGLAYVSIPVHGDTDLDLGSARELDAILGDAARGPFVVACASGNRSGALLAVRAFWLQRDSAAEALALGKAAGLTKLEPSVRQLLGLPPLPPAPAPPTAPEPPAAPPPR